MTAVGLRFVALFAFAFLLAPPCRAKVARALRAFPIPFRALTALVRGLRPPAPEACGY